MSKPAAKKRPEKLAFRVHAHEKHGFLLSPADSYSYGRMQDKRYRHGDLVFAAPTKPRNPGFHRHAHNIGTLLAENIDDFEGMQAHAVLKRLQLETGIGCDEYGYRLDGRMLFQRVPYSLSYESMDDGEFREVIAGFCQHICDNYWHSLEPRDVEDMASRRGSMTPA